MQGDEMMAKKLSPAQEKALETLKDGEYHKINHNTGDVLRKLEMVSRIINPNAWGWKAGYVYKITKAGRDYLAALDSKAEAAPAQPAGDFGVGDRVVIRKDAIVEHVAFIADELAELRDNQVQGEVISIREYPNGDPIKVQFPKDYYFFTPDELTLWTPAEPGSDAKAYTYPEYVTEFAPEHGNTDKPERKMPFMGTRSNPCCKERDALIAERDKLLLSEQRYHEEVERLRAAMQEIVDLPEDSFKSAWSIAVAALAEAVNS